MMMEPSPPSALIMSKPNLLFELLVIAFNPPTQFGEID
jgi:hypothetical protein